MSQSQDQILCDHQLLPGHRIHFHYIRRNSLRKNGEIQSLWTPRPQFAMVQMRNSECRELDASRQRTEQGLETPESEPYRLNLQAIETLTHSPGFINVPSPTLNNINPSPNHQELSSIHCVSQFTSNMRGLRAACTGGSRIKKRIGSNLNTSLDTLTRPFLPHHNIPPQVKWNEIIPFTILIDRQISHHT